jgi:hypothetical protein
MPVNEREQGVVATLTNTWPSFYPGPSLPYEDAACSHLTAEDLDPQPLSIRIAAVARRAATFFVRHYM